MTLPFKPEFPQSLNLETSLQNVFSVFRTKSSVIRLRYEFIDISNPAEGYR